MEPLTKNPMTLIELIAYFLCSSRNKNNGFRMLIFKKAGGNYTKKHWCKTANKDPSILLNYSTKM